MANILVIGSGGREHALCWRLKQSPTVAKIFCAPGNGGIGEDVTCVTLATPDDIIAFCKKETIALVVIGPEQPLVEGLSDVLEQAGIPAFGPSKLAAQLEGSKGFMKALCKKYNIPTADYGYFDNAADAHGFLAGKTYPIVVKADGLAAGKGVIIAQNQAEAKAAIDDMFGGIIAGGSQVVIEEFLSGEEVSFFALTDGNSAIEFGYAQDHKRAYDGDQGPNTGGMGTFSPSLLMNRNLRKKVMETIIYPTVHAMQKEGHPFKGLLFAGLMFTKDGPKLLEYNARFGDPETQVLMARLKSDLFPLLMWCTGHPSPIRGEARSGAQDGTILSNDAPTPPLPLMGREYSVCVVMASNGYPGEYKKGSVIKNLDAAGKISGVKIFHAGTEKRGKDMVAVGGRVLGVTATGATLKEAQQKAYDAVGKIDWPEGFCRKDIAWRAIN